MGIGGSSKLFEVPKGTTALELKRRIESAGVLPQVKVGDMRLFLNDERLQNGYIFGASDDSESPTVTIVGTNPAVSAQARRLWVKNLVDKKLIAAYIDLESTTCNGMLDIVTDACGLVPALCLLFSVSQEELTTSCHC